MTAGYHAAMLKNLPPVTRALLLASIAAYLIQYFTGNLLPGLFALWPAANPRFQPWQLITYAFLHSGTTHLLFNMLALYMFGAPLEQWFGTRRFSAYYFVCVVVAAAVQLAVTAAANVNAPTLGASGGIFGLLLAFAWYFPRQRIMLLIPPIPMPAWLFVLLYGLLELVLGVTGNMSDVAHFAHLGGMLGGAAMILFWRATDHPRGRRP